MASRVAGNPRPHSTGSAASHTRRPAPAAGRAAYVHNPPGRAAPRTAHTCAPESIAPDPHRAAATTRTTPHPRARSGTVWASSFFVEKGEHLLGTLITSAPEGAYFLPTLFEGGSAYAINDRARAASGDHRSACSRSCARLIRVTSWEYSCSAPTEPEAGKRQRSGAHPTSRVAQCKSETLNDTNLFIMIYT